MTIPFPQPDFPYTDVQRSWIAHLLGEGDREFEQGEGALRNDENYYCCLGVLCALSSEAVRADFVHVEESVENYYFMGESEILPNAIRLHGGLRDTGGNPYHTVGCTYHSVKTIESWLHENWMEEGHQIPGGEYVYRIDTLVELNDQGVSFEKIGNHLLRFPHFYFSNGGRPTEEMYPHLTRGFDP